MIFLLADSSPLRQLFILRSPAVSEKLVFNKLATFKDEIMQSKFCHMH